MTNSYSVGVNNKYVNVHPLGNFFLKKILNIFYAYFDIKLCKFTAICQLTLLIEIP